MLYKPVGFLVILYSWNFMKQNTWNKNTSIYFIILYKNHTGPWYRMKQYHIRFQSD
jgi:hypothetical protein